MANEFFHCYRHHRFQGKAQKTVDQANVILADLRGQGYTLTLRQLYYQFVKANLLPNEEKQYKRLGRLITNAREAGIMDWNAIHDLGRTVYGTNPQEDPSRVVSGIERKLVFDQWARQDTYIEVWVEKQALEGVISRPASRLHVNYMACKGYLSASEAWRAGLRFQSAINQGKHPIMIHLADHDPSGLNMTEDNTNRLRLFAEDQGVEVRRIALNMDQVDHYGPPPNPAKETDSRAKAYVAKYGPHSWELDALEPKVIDQLITDTVDEYRDMEIWDQVLEEQAEARRPLEALGNNWTMVENFMRDEGLF